MFSQSSVNGKVNSGQLVNIGPNRTVTRGLPTLVEFTRFSYRETTSGLQDYF